MLDVMRQNAQSWFIKALFGIIILAFIITFGYSFKGNNSNVVAYVNEVPVTLPEFKEAYDSSLERMRAQFPQVDDEFLKAMGFKKQVLNQLTDSILLRQAAERMEISVSGAEMRARIAEIKAFHKDGRFDNETYKQVLAQNGLTPARFEADVKRQMTFEKLTANITATADVTEAEARELFTYARETATADYVLFDAADYLAKITPGKEEVEAYYKENEQDFAVPAMISIDYMLFTPATLAKPADVTDEDVQAFFEANQGKYSLPERVKARHILIQVPQNADQKQVDEAKARIEKIRKEIKSAKGFAKAAQTYSEGPSAPGGGDLGWFGRGQMVPPFEKAAFSLKKGEISEPVRTRFGWHLILLEDHEDARPMTIEEVRDPIRRKLAEDKAADALSDTLDEATSRLVAGEDPQALADAMGVALKHSGFFEAGKSPNGLRLDAEAAELLGALPEGGVTDAPLMVDGGYLLAKRTGERPEMIRPLAEVQDEIESILKEKAAQDMASKDAARFLAELDEPARAEKVLAGATIMTTEPFTRQGMIPGLGQNEEFAKAVFDAKGDAWLKKVFDSPLGAFIAKPNTVTTPGDEQWGKEKKIWIETLTQRKQQQLFQSWLENERKQAKIEIALPELFD